VACHLVSSSAWHEYVKPKGRRRWEVVRLLIHQRILKPVWMSASATDRHASLDPWTVAVHLVHERPLLADSGLATAAPGQRRVFFVPLRAVVM
jgi:hypothetical protein